MTKAEIVSQISDSTGIERVIVAETIENFFITMKSNMEKGENIYFRGFGSFILQKRAKKVARNISKNTAIVIDAHFIPKFKPAKEFVEKVKTTIPSDFVPKNEEKNV